MAMAIILDATSFTLARTTFRLRGVTTPRTFPENLAFYART